MKWHCWHIFVTLPKGWTAIRQCDENHRDEDNLLRSTGEHETLLKEFSCRFLLPVLVGKPELVNQPKVTALAT